MSTSGELIYEKPFCKLTYFIDANTIYMDIIGVFTLEEYKEMFRAALEKIIEKKANGLIADQTHSNGSNMEHRVWLVMKWLPELKSKIANPNFRVVGISPTKVVGFKKFIADYLEKTFRTLTPFPIMRCSTFEEAITWMEAEEKKLKK
jgi:hypothetical protein